MYQKYFGFRKRPFDLVPDPDFLFLGESHDSALANLQLGIESGKGFVVITGGVGTGKTTILRAVLRRIRREMDVGFLNQPDLDSSDLLRTVLLEFDVEDPGSDRVMLRRRLREVLLDRARPAILVIDEAHLLSEESLEQVRLLSNFEESDRKLLQIVLAGQPELKELLSRPRLRPLAQRIEMFYEIRPLAPEETAAYVERRVQIAGNPEDLRFEPKALAEIHARTGGVPRLINLLAERALITTYVAGTKTVTQKIVREAFFDLGEVTQRVMVAGEPEPLAFQPLPASEPPPASLAPTSPALSSSRPLPASPPTTTLEATPLPPPSWRRRGRWDPEVDELDEAKSKGKRRLGRWLAALGLGGAVAGALIAMGTHRAMSSKPGETAKPQPAGEAPGEPGAAASPGIALDHSASSPSRTDSRDVAAVDPSDPDASSAEPAGKSRREADPQRQRPSESRGDAPDRVPPPVPERGSAGVKSSPEREAPAAAIPPANPPSSAAIPAPPLEALRSASSSGSRGAPSNAANASSSSAPSRASSSSRFAIQCGSFRDVERARELAARVAETSADEIRVAESEMASGTWYRVLLGSFDSETDAIARLGDVRMESETLVLQVVRIPDESPANESGEE